MLGAGPETLDFLCTMPLLQKLSITKCFVRDEDLLPIQQLANLQLLGICEANRMSGENHTCREVSAQNANHQLSCNVDSTFKGDSSYSSCNCSSIELGPLINFGGKMLVGTIFKHLTGLTKLEGLTLEGSNHMSDEGVACLAMLTTLRQLHLVRFNSCSCVMLYSPLCTSLDMSSLSSHCS